MSKPSTPQPPDYVGQANATSQGSVNAAIANAGLNRADQYTPYGNLTWAEDGFTMIPGTGSAAIPGTPGHWEGGYDIPGTSSGITGRGGNTAGGPPQHIGGKWIPGTEAVAAVPGTPGQKIPKYKSTITLSPEGQKLFDADTAQRLGLSNAAVQSLGQVQNSLKDPFSLENAMPAYNQQVADALYNRATRYLDPQWDSSEDKERSRLANSGFSQQDEGYGRAIGNFDRAKEMAYANARDNATTTAGTIGLAQRQQDISEKLLGRTQPLAELNALRTGAAPQLPNFPSTNIGAGVQGPNLLGAAGAQGQAAGDIYNAKTGTYNSQVGTVAQLGMLAYLAAL